MAKSKAAKKKGGEKTSVPAQVPKWLKKLKGNELAEMRSRLAYLSQLDVKKALASLNFSVRYNNLRMSEIPKDAVTVADAQRRAQLKREAQELKLRNFVLLEMQQQQKGKSNQAANLSGKSGQKVNMDVGAHHGQGFLSAPNCNFRSDGNSINGNAAVANTSRCTAADGTQVQQPERKEIIDKRAVEMFCHAVHDDINCCVDPETKELVTKPSMRLIEFLKEAKETVKTLIETGTFIKVSDCIVETKKAEMSIVGLSVRNEAMADVVADANQHIKVESIKPKENTLAGAKLMTQQCGINWHGSADNHQTPPSKKRRLFGSKSDHILKILDEKTAERLIDEGLLVNVGSSTARNNDDEREAVLKKGVFRLAVGQQTGARVEIVSNGNRSIYVFGLDVDLMRLLMAGRDISASLDAAAEETFSVAPNIVEAMMSSMLALMKGNSAAVNITGMLNVRKAILGSAYTNAKVSAGLVMCACNFECQTVSFMHEGGRRTYVVRLNGDKIDMSIFPEEPTTRSEIMPANVDDGKVSQEEIVYLGETHFRARQSSPPSIVGGPFPALDRSNGSKDSLAYNPYVDCSLGFFPSSSVASTSIVVEKIRNPRVMADGNSKTPPISSTTVRQRLTSNVPYERDNRDQESRVQPFIKQIADLQRKHQQQLALLVRLQQEEIQNLASAILKD